MSRPQHRRMDLIVSLLAASFVVWQAAPAEARAAPPPIRRALETHLAAVKARDLPALAPRSTPAQLHRRLAPWRWSRSPASPT